MKFDDLPVGQKFRMSGLSRTYTKIPPVMAKGVPLSDCKVYLCCVYECDHDKDVLKFFHWYYEYDHLYSKTLL